MSISNIPSNPLQPAAPLVEPSEQSLEAVQKVQNLVFVDAAVKNPEQLLSGIKADEIVLLDSTRDGIDQITSVLAQHHNLASVHIFSHGETGIVQLGNTFISATNLDHYASQLKQWGDSLDQQGDLLFYGCNVATGLDGQSFVEQISQITGADVAASNDVTGTTDPNEDWNLDANNTALEGDWDLEITVGDIEANSVTNVAALEKYEGTLPLYNGNRYELTSSLKTWEAAQAEAASLGGNLVTINNAAEETWLKQTFGDTEGFWIGINDRRAEGQFEWASGEAVTYTNWAPGEPNNGGGAQDYGWMNFGTTKQWDDTSPAAQYKGIIEIKGGSTNPGVFGLETSTITTNEGAGTALVTVLRNQGSTGTVTIDYRTVAGTATAGSDYTGQTGTLTFAPGETRKSVSIPILKDSLIEGDEIFGFAIDNPTGGATLLVPRTAQVTIKDDEGSIYNGNRYILTNTAKTWEAAKVEAESLGGNLVTINNAAEETWLKQTFGDTEGFWIGINDRRAEGQFEWTSGEAVTYTNWAPGEPNNGGGVQDYGWMNAGTTKQWDDASPTTQYKGIIEISPTFNGKRYALTSTAKTWEAAQVEAASLGGNLVTVNNAAEETWLKQTFGDTEGFWIGINDRRAEGQFEWANGEAVTYTNWAPGEPNNGGGAQDYGWMNFGTAKQWDDTSATAQYRGIIEIDPGSPSEQAVTKETVIFGLEQPTAIEWTPGGSKMLVAEKGGVVRVYENGALLPTPFIDISARVNVSADRGLLDIAIHPDFPNTPYVYLLYAYDPPEVNNYIGDAVAGPDGVGNRAGRLTRVTADASTNYTTAVPGSEVILLGTNSTWANFNGLVNSTIDFDEPPAGILPNGTNLRDFLAADSDSHTIGSVEFGLDGALYVTNGDGTSYNRVDPRTVRVQDIDNLSGKVLRINPITGAGLPDNPFYNGDSAANRSKVYQYGLRNPFRTTVHPQTGQLFVGDVGWTKWEEVNTAGPGANFGWPYFEGGSGTNFRTEEYQNLPEAQAFYASGQTTTPSIFALSHSADGINAIVMGDVYTGSLYPEKYRGDLFVNDLGQGIVRNISFDTSGDIESVETFTTGANVVVQIIQGPDGKLYYVDLDDGVVGRWTVV
ncbi:DUF4347 domain-containing protein [Phormidium tenue FACHB-886]|nr:DUF4347 domain-containing protein [Phormidium tenue FACHB-886]